MEFHPFSNFQRTIWGVAMLSMGYVKNWSGLMAARWWLGVAEAGLYPGVNYFLSCWYKRDEFGVRAVSVSMPLKLPFH
jgi:MFS family permease